MINDYSISGGRKPIYEHDCRHCRFLGTIVRRGEHEKPGTRIITFARDVYFCTEHDDDPALILRTGSYGGDYRSYGFRMLKRLSIGDDVLTIATCMAEGALELDRIGVQKDGTIPDTSHLDRSRGRR